MSGLRLALERPPLRGLAKCSYPLSSGMATFEQTRPVSVRAAFSKPSVPALYNISPPGLKPRHLQLPSGCLRVRQAVSTSPRPFSQAAEDNRRDFDLESCTPPSSSSSSSSEVSLDVGAGGSRYACTCPEDRPTARTGSIGWRVWAKRSEDRGRVQIVSNIFAESSTKWNYWWDRRNWRSCSAKMTEICIDPHPPPGLG